MIKALIVLLLQQAVLAADWQAATCSGSDVQGAINSAANGDRVLVPAGSCTWTSQINIRTKRITLQGAGIDQTVITTNISGTSAISAGQITSPLQRITGFTFDGNNSDPGGNDGLITFGGNSSGLDVFRFDHIKMTNLGHRGFFIYQDGNEVSGLIDHFECVKTTSNSVQCLTVDGSAPQSRVQFSRPLSLGTNKAIYIEDSVFTYSFENDGALDGYNGVRYVFRYNTMTGTTIGHHGADSGDGAGVAGFEVYNNTISAPGSAVSRVGFWRSGVGVVFGNTVTGTFSGGITAITYRSCSSFSYWGQCNGSSPWDENQSGQQGYACLDQVGHYFTQNQGGSNTLSPYYSWSNTLNSSTLSTSVDNGNCAAEAVHLQLNREVYNSTASFDGTTGMGVGTLAARPSTCTPITGYWASDTSTLYKCATTDNWTSYYTPYTYPHPLQGASEAVGSKVSMGGKVSKR